MMRRVLVGERPNWQETVESTGLTFHSRTAPYWNEGVAYEFTSAEIDTLEKAANDVHELCLRAVEHVIRKDRFSQMAIGTSAAQLIVDSWERDQLHLYGRFDFSWDGRNATLLEYNADTPTSLLEAAVTQWYWLEDKVPRADQFNSLHESLIARWRKMGIEGTTHFAAFKGIEEDVMTVEYLRDTADQAGLCTKSIGIEDIGYNEGQRAFKDMEEQTITTLFKLHPWEIMVSQPFGPHCGKARFIEPAWKMLWSNKAILPILWELEPNHPNLLRASRQQDFGPCYVRKPIYSREGANVSIHDGVGVTESDGDYGAEGHIYQDIARPLTFEGKTPILGLWMIGDECKGMGIRESDGPITDNTSRFTPHYFV